MQRAVDDLLGLRADGRHKGLACTGDGEHVTLVQHGIGGRVFH